MLPLSYRDAVNEMADWIDRSEKTIVFTGAGVSTESGLPDFRSPGGIWATSQPVYYQDFLASADSREEYWRQKSVAVQQFASAKPNVAHELLAKWEKDRDVAGVITQNIDGLHQIAGSRRVWELHGTAREAACVDCGKRSAVTPLTEEFLKTGEPPLCKKCGGFLKHATVSFGQQLDENVLYDATQNAIESDLFIVLGSSLVVHPAAGIPQLSQENGARLIIINRDKTPLDGVANIIIRQGIGETLQEVDSAISKRRGR